MNALLKFTNTKLAKSWQLVSVILKLTSSSTAGAKLPPSHRRNKKTLSSGFTTRKKDRGIRILRRLTTCHAPSQFTKTAIYFKIVMKSTKLKFMTSAWANWLENSLTWGTYNIQACWSRTSCSSWRIMRMSTSITSSSLTLGPAKKESSKTESSMRKEREVGTGFAIWTKNMRRWFLQAKEPLRTGRIKAPPHLSFCTFRPKIRRKWK